MVGLSEKLRPDLTPCFVVIPNGSWLDPDILMLRQPFNVNPNIPPLAQMVASENRDTRSSHLFLDGIFPEINHPAAHGVPPWLRKHPAESSSPVLWPLRSCPSLTRWTFRPTRSSWTWTGPRWADGHWAELTELRFFVVGLDELDHPKQWLMMVDDGWLNDSSTSGYDMLWPLTSFFWWTESGFNRSAATKNMAVWPKLRWSSRPFTSWLCLPVGRVDNRWQESSVFSDQNNGNNGLLLHQVRTCLVDERNPAPVDGWLIPLFLRFQPSKVVQDFFHSQYSW